MMVFQKLSGNLVASSFESKFKYLTKGLKEIEVNRAESWDGYEVYHMVTLQMTYSKKYLAMVNKMAMYTTG